MRKSIIFYLVGLVSLVWSLGRVTQVIMDGLFHPFHLVEKTVILNTLGRIVRSYELYMRREEFFYYPDGICFRGFHTEKIVLTWNQYSFCSYMGPNQDRIMDQMASRLSVRPQMSFMKTGTHEGIGQLLIGFCVYVSVVVRRFWWRKCLFTVNILNLTRPCLIKLAKIWKPLLLHQDCTLDKDGVVSTYYKI